MNAPTPLHTPPGQPKVRSAPAVPPTVTTTVEEIARVAHEVNRAYCQALGDTSHTDWAHAPPWQRESAIAGVNFHLANPTASASASHENWRAEKAAAGWTYGPFKEPHSKKHPCMVPFEKLPLEQQAKDHLFRGVVHALAGLP